ncbi:AI-2E family transporter [Rhodopila globiformis]|nr:AI-2E family transporter [Rhodopila globiformis]
MNPDAPSKPGGSDRPQWRGDGVMAMRGTAWRVILAGAAAVLIWQLSDVLLLLFLACLIATAIRGAADRLAAWLHAPPGLMLGIVIVLLTLASLATAYWVGPAVVGQLGDLVTRLSGTLQALHEHYSHTAAGRAVTGHLPSVPGIARKLFGNLFTFASLTLGVLGSIFVVVVVSLYLAIAPALYVNGVVRLVPFRHRALARSVMDELGHDLRFWLLGQLVDMLAVGILSAIGLYFLGVPAPFALAVLAGLLTIVPYFGALAAAVPAVLVALANGWMAVVWVIVIFTGCHVIEGYVIAPLVQRHMVHLPPALTIIAMTVAAALFGVLGIVLGTPLAVAAMVIVRRVYLEHVLGDRVA